MNLKKDDNLQKKKILTFVCVSINLGWFKNLPGCLFIRTFFTEEFL